MYIGLARYATGITALNPLSSPPDVPTHDTTVIKANMDGKD